MDCVSEFNGMRGVERDDDSDCGDAIVNGHDGDDGVVESSSAAASKVNERLKKRAKRTAKVRKDSSSSTGSGSNGGVAVSGPGAAGQVNGARTLKNLRRPRNGYGRGLPKKGGAGGKGVWGKPGSELAIAEVMDEKDPNYDSDSLDNGDVTVEVITPKLSVQEIRKHVEPIILEYYEHGVTQEVILALEDYNFGEDKYQVVVLAIELAMDHKPSNREMTSVLLSDLHEQFLIVRNGQEARKKADMENAMDQLLRNLPDLVLDTPEAPTILGNFIARAVADDILAPRYLNSYQGKVTCDLAKQALARADVLLSMKHGMTRLDNVWGVGGGLRPVTSLVRSMGLLLQEYLTSGDAPEASRCLNELEVPHFHHELVYEAIVLALESVSEDTENSIVKLLKSLSASVVITPDQMRNGFFRVLDDMEDISLDVPNAGQILERLGEKCKNCSLISEDVMQKLKVRGRKRFVSEGDGGRFKD